MNTNDLLQKIGDLIDQKLEQKLVAERAQVRKIFKEEVEKSAGQLQIEFHNEIGVVLVELKKEIVSVGKDIVSVRSEMRDRMVAMEGRLDTIEGRLDTIQGELDTIQGELDTIQGELDTIQGQLDVINGDQARILTVLKVVATQGDLEEMGEKLGGRIDEFEEVIRELRAAIVDLGARLGRGQREQDARIGKLEHTLGVVLK